MNTTGLVHPSVLQVYGKATSNISWLDHGWMPYVPSFAIVQQIHDADNDSCYPEELAGLPSRRILRIHGGCSRPFSSSEWKYEVDEVRTPFLLLFFDTVLRFFRLCLSVLG